MINLGDMLWAMLENLVSVQYWKCQFNKNPLPCALILVMLVMGGVHQTGFDKIANVSGGHNSLTDLIVPPAKATVDMYPAQKLLSNDGGDDGNATVKPAEKRGPVFTYENKTRYSDNDWMPMLKMNPVNPSGFNETKFFGVPNNIVVPDAGTIDQPERLQPKALTNSINPITKLDYEARISFDPQQSAKIGSDGFRHIGLNGTKLTPINLDVQTPTEKKIGGSKSKTQVVGGNTQKTTKVLGGKKTKPYNIA